MYKCLIALLAAAVLMPAAVWAEGSGQARIGYTILDETGNLSVNRESFNLYEGPGLSLENFQYLTPTGFNLSADLKNITLNNRDLRASLYKPGLLGVTLNNSQYRRIYSFDGDKFTRRRTTGGQGYFEFLDHFKVFGGYSQTDRFGENPYMAQPYGNILPYTTDYSNASYNVGGQAFFKQGSLRMEYRRFDLTDNTGLSGDRESQNFTVSGSAPLPRYDKIVVSGGYRYRLDRNNGAAAELKTYQGWAATRYTMPKGFAAEYRLVAARSEHTEYPVAIDNYVNTVSISRTWVGRAVVRAGYENRISDDIFNQTVSNGFLFSGWYKYDRLLVRAGLSTRKKAVRSGVTLVGDEDYMRHRVYARYNVTDWGDLSLDYQGRIRDNDDIDTHVDYNAITAAANVKREKYGKLSVTYSYYRGKYENRAPGAPLVYEFYDHVITGTATAVEYRHVLVSVGGSYYRSKRDRDIEKIGGQIDARYNFPDGYAFEARYRVLNYDDYLLFDNYYTGNIVELNFIKAFTL